MTRTTTGEALRCWCTVGIKKVLPSLHRIVVVGDDILHNSQVAEFSAPTTPVAETSKVPPFVGHEILAASTAERVCTIWIRVDCDIKQIVAEHFQELLRCLRNQHRQASYTCRGLTIGTSFWATRSPEAILRKTNPLFILLALIQSAKARTGQRWAS